MYQIELIPGTCQVTVRFGSLCEVTDRQGNLKFAGTYDEVAAWCVANGFVGMTPSDGSTTTCAAVGTESGDIVRFADGKTEFEVAAVCGGTVDLYTLDRRQRLTATLRLLVPVYE